MTELEFMQIYALILQRDKSPVVNVDTTQGAVFVPREFIEADGSLYLNISPDAVRDLKVENDIVYCRATFNGQHYSLSFPLGNIIEIFEED